MVARISSLRCSCRCSCSDSSSLAEDTEGFDRSDEDRFRPRTRASPLFLVMKSSLPRGEAFVMVRWSLRWLAIGLTSHHTSRVSELPEATLYYFGTEQRCLERRAPLPPRFASRRRRPTFFLIGPMTLSGTSGTGQ
jgi:hypothetical protein